MSERTDFKELRAKIKRKLEEANVHEDFGEVVRLGRIAQELGAIENDEMRIAERKERIATELRQRGSEQILNPAELGITKDLSAKAKGDSVRSRWVQNLHHEGISLQRLRGKRYETLSGMKVGIAYASELDVRPDAWFLGLADENFSIVVLLCEPSDKNVIDFVFPYDFVKQIWNRLSRSHGQVKFNVVKSGSNYELRLSGAELISINQFRGAHKLMK
jgi:hypothetical protein